MTALEALCQGMKDNTARCLSRGECPRCGHDQQRHQHPESYTSGVLYTDCDDCAVCNPRLRLQELLQEIQELLLQEKLI